MDTKAGSNSQRRPGIKLVESLLFTSVGSGSHLFQCDCSKVKVLLQCEKVKLNLTLNENGLLSDQIPSISNYHHKYLLFLEIDL